VPGEWGGGAALGALQSAGLSEGWSDFFSFSLLSKAADNLNGNYVMGGYVGYKLFGQMDNYYFGIRRYPCTTDLSKNPLTFRDIDPSQASRTVAFREALSLARAWPA